MKKQRIAGIVSVVAMFICIIEFIYELANGIFDLSNLCLILVTGTYGSLYLIKKRTNGGVDSMMYKGRAQCIVVRDHKILMVKHCVKDNVYYCTPGGGIEVGETL